MKKQASRFRNERDTANRKASTMEATITLLQQQVQMLSTGQNYMPRPSTPLMFGVPATTIAPASTCCSKERESVDSIEVPAYMK